MDNFKIIKRPQSNPGVKIEYQMSEELILKTTILKFSSENDVMEVERELYFDLSSFDKDSYYLGEYPVSSITTTADNIEAEVINTVGNEWTEEEASPQWEEITFEEFEIPDNSEIIILEKMVIPEPEPSPVDKLTAENFDLKNRVNSLQASMIQNQQDTEELMISLMNMMF